MTVAGRDYVKLLIGREAGTRDRYLIAQRATADYYGWTKEFPAWRPRMAPGQSDPNIVLCPSRRGELRTEAGKRLVISRAPSTAGWPRGKANAFKVSNNCTNLDLAEIAHFVDVDWYWMEGLFGQRRSREEWEAIYQSGNTRVRGGLVSA